MEREPDAFDEAVERLRAGALVAFPTESVWGLAADATSATAIAALCAWKGRPAGQPLSILVTGLAAAEPLGCEIPPLARRAAERLWPGPITLVLPMRQGSAGLAPGVARADGSLGLRCSSHPVAHALAVACEARRVGPITATSLNRSGEPAARTLRQAAALCRSESAAWLLALGEADAFGGAESTLVDFTGTEPRVLRAGAVSLAALEELLGVAIPADSCRDATRDRCSHAAPLPRGSR